MVRRIYYTLLDPQTTPDTKKSWGDFVAVALPAILDLASSGLNFMGLLCINASVWQMLRGSMIVFSCGLSVLILGRKMFGFHCVGVLLCVTGITCVGAASVLGTPEVGLFHTVRPACWGLRR